jgi:hypothetical protein
MMEPDAKSAKDVMTRTVIDAKMPLLESVISVRKVSLDLKPVLVSSAPKVASSARTPVPASCVTESISSSKTPRTPTLLLK